MFVLRSVTRSVSSIAHISEYYKFNNAEFLNENQKILSDTHLVSPIIHFSEY